MRGFRQHRNPPKIAPVQTAGGFKLKMGVKPPCYDDVAAAFGIQPQAYFTYGDTIYCVDVPFPPGEIVEHEKVHMAQHLAMLPEGTEPTPENYEKGAALWWGKFLREPEFRIDQEARAYGKQYACICRSTNNRQIRFDYLKRLASSLSGPLYHNAIGHMEAMTKIRGYSGVK